MRAILCLCALMLVAAAPSNDRTMLDQCNKVANDWNAKFTAEGFDVVVAPPFVIAGNTGKDKLARWRDGTILAAKDALTTMYFKTPVDKPVLILLFNDPDSYRKLSLKWLNERSVPHYGMYRHHDRTMLMNIATGGGTLIHELVHALIAADFPKVPDWFNEGFASLYEQCAFTGQNIRGLTNWRLPPLQDAIRAGKLRPLKEMIEDEDFRNDERIGINYAQARYLMLYLQQDGKLTAYYTKFRDEHEKDPTGLTALKTVLGTEDIEAFDRKWQQWVLKLKFER